MPNGCTGKWMQRFATRRTPHSPTIATVQRFGNRRGREGAQPDAEERAAITEHDRAPFRNEVKPLAVPDTDDPPTDF